MLEPTRPYGAPVKAYLSPLITTAVAKEAWEVEAYWRLRREIFCDELEIFAGSEHERDRNDVHAVPIAAISHSAGNPEAVVGVVRVYPAEAGVWYGGRLGVAKEYRMRPQVGAGLIACAVRTAAAHGCNRFLAQVLAENASYFTRHNFSALSELDLFGRKHVLMQANIAAFTGTSPRAKSRPRRGEHAERAA